MAGGRCAENDFLAVDISAGIDATAADPGALGCERDELVSEAGQARTCSVSRTRDVTCLNSPIHESQSSSLACALAFSAGLLGARGVGSVSAALGSACLPAVRTRSYADVAASACGVMAVKHEHARNSVVSGGFLPVQKSTSYNLDKGRQGPTGRRGSKGVVSGPAEDFAPCLRGGGSGKFSVRRRQVAGSLPRKQPGAAGSTGCGRTFPPPGGSWYPIRVTWIRFGHQAINGLDEGVWNHTVGDLGVKG